MTFTLCLKIPQKMDRITILLAKRAIIFGMKYWKDNSNETFLRDLQTLALGDELSNWTYLIYQAPLIYDTYNCTMYEPYEPILEANEIDVDKLSCPYAPKFICNLTQKKFQGKISGRFYKSLI